MTQETISCEIPVDLHEAIKKYAAELRLSEEEWIRIACLERAEQETAGTITGTIQVTKLEEIIRRTIEKIREETEGEAFFPSGSEEAKKEEPVSVR